MTYKHIGSTKINEASCINLSATGLLFRTHEAIAVGTALSINIQSDAPLALPLHALVETKRLNKIADNQYEVAVAIEGLKGV
ncbi:MAG: hypothetical protein A6F71_05425 [Cycloclasticus sp. symbiont of Poecilosclerida sp. M]|nr:MAG: hypothetical protein A6F71_05425 [Cycloclasticus sp. symbiont of Poecilosclerida sp. M]